MGETSECTGLVVIVHLCITFLPNREKGFKGGKRNQPRPCSSVASSEQAVSKPKKSSRHTISCTRHVSNALPQNSLISPENLGLLLPPQKKSFPNHHLFQGVVYSGPLPINAMRLNTSTSFPWCHWLQPGNLIGGRWEGGRHPSPQGSYHHRGMAGGIEISSFKL